MADRDPDRRLRARPVLGRPAARAEGRSASLSLEQGLLVGLAQSLALAPGVSRSGITISAGRFLGLDRDAAARLSFLLLVPIVLGAVLLKGYTDVLKGELPAGWVGPFVVGTIASAGGGLLAINWLLGYVRGHNYTVFVVYRLVLAACILLVDRLRRPRRDVLMVPYSSRTPSPRLGWPSSSATEPGVELDLLTGQLDITLIIVCGLMSARG